MDADALEEGYQTDVGAVYGCQTSLRWSNRTFQSTRVK